MTVQFLAATQSLFEFGILSHEKILDASSSVRTTVRAEVNVNNGNQDSFDNCCSNNNAKVN